MAHPRGAADTIGQPERATQNRVIALFRDELGYRFLGDRSDRDDNSNIEEELLADWLTKNGCTPAQITVALHKLRAEADNHSRTLYGNNQAVYKLLRYGVPELKNSPALRALYNNLKGDAGTPVWASRVAEPPGEYSVSGDPVLDLALQLDATVKRVRPDGWRGV